MKLISAAGLFDPVSTQPWWKLGQGDIGTAASAKLNLQAAQSSLVLIQNPAAVLPLSTQGTHIAVIGPHGNASRDLIQHDTGKICPTAEPWDGGHSQTMFDCVRSPHQEIAAINSAGTTTYTQGSEVASAVIGGLEAAVATARNADVVVLGLLDHLKVGRGVLQNLDHVLHSRDLVGLGHTAASSFPRLDLSTRAKPGQ